jgi:Iron-containing redox enzyme
MSSVAMSERVRLTLGLLLPGVSTVGTRFWNADNLAALYPRYLVALHTIIRASVPLMEEALRVTQERHMDEPLGGPLAAYLARHIPEETFHDEWLVEDLARIGYDRRVVTEHSPSPTVAAMVGAQYYYIHHVHPVVLMGYIAVLEGYPPSEDLAVQAAQRTGYPVGAFRTLRKHAHLDVHHCKDLDAAINQMPTDERLAGLIGANALQTLARLRTMMEEVLNGEVASWLSTEMVAS